MEPFHIIIPARYASRRLPGKPLADIGGKHMIQRVVECAAGSAARSVTVATDDERIVRAVKGFGGAVVLTAAAHSSGTDRVAEAARQLGLDARALIVNLQGDEPDMPAALIEQVAALLAQTPNAALATACAPLDDAAQLADPSVVKVVTDRHGGALYFSRAAIPWAGDTAAAATVGVRRHLGIYAYRHDYLQSFTARPACDLERRERLEQLRALWHGDTIACAEAVAVPAPGIDTAADLERARKRWAQRG